MPRRHTRRPALAAAMVLVAAVLVGTMGTAPPAGAAAVTGVGFFGGSDLDSPDAVAVDAAGNSIVVGSFGGTATFFTPSATTRTAAGSLDGFVASYRPNGTLAWISQITGSAMDTAYDVALDGSGNIYVAGRSASATLNLGAGVTATTGGGEDGYVAKFTSSGVPVWVRLVTGADEQILYGVGVAGSTVYVAGTGELGPIALTGSSPAITRTPVNGIRTGVIAAFSTSGVPKWLVVDRNIEYFALDAGGFGPVLGGVVWGDALLGSGGTEETVSANGMSDATVVS